MEVIQNVEKVTSDSIAPLSATSANSATSATCTFCQMQVNG